MALRSTVTVGCVHLMLSFFSRTIDARLRMMCRCKIEWNKGKNVTVKTIKKVQKHKKGGQRRTVAKQIKNDSFFNFFDPPKLPDVDQPEGTSNEELDHDKVRFCFLRNPHCILMLVNCLCCFACSA